jgi:hypothetical protein
MIEGASAGDGRATVSWTPPVASDPATLTGYEVTPYIDHFALPPRPYGPETTTVTIAGLTNGVSYRFRVRASNAVGTGPYSKVSNVVTPSVAAAT